MQIPDTVKKIWNVASTVLVAIVVIFAVLLVGVRLFDIQVYSVISGSMEPEYPVGSLIYVKEVDPSEIEVGDVITYVLPNDMPSTHRVIGVDAANQHFYTKGDANDIADGSPVHFKNLIGTPVFKIPLLGYVAYYIQHPPGMYIAIAVGAILLILVFLPDLFKKDGKKEAAVATSAASAVATTEKAEDAKASEATSSETDGNQTQG
jgi:signal peptidase